jgi:KDO2-lipid IV(A) lauroyltransferase
LTKGYCFYSLNSKWAKKSSPKKFFEVHLEYLLFKILIFWVRHLSIESLQFYGEFMGTLASYLLRKRKRIALSNLHLALGKEKNKEEIERICLESFKNIGKDIMETTRYFDFEESYLKMLVKLEGKEHLDHALKEGNGVIGLTAHFGNFPLMAVRLVNEGYSLSLVARDPENLKIARMVTSASDKAGMESIPDKPRMTCVSRCLKVLKGNRILLMQIDQNAPATACWVDFFGYLVPTFKGPFIFSLRTGAPILPMFIIRNPDDHHKIIIHPAPELATIGNTHEDIASNIARLTKIVEATIREYPEQWWWVHRRFKRARDPKTGKRMFHKHL